MPSSRFGRIDRRRLIATSALGGVAILTAGQAAEASPRSSVPTMLVAQDGSVGVPMFRGNAARTGEMPGPGPDDSNGVEAIWTFSTGAAIEWSSPAVVDGVVYVGSDDKNLYAIDVEDGIERWRFATSEAIFASPAVVDGVVYLGSNDGNLYAVNVTDGTERWRFTTGGPIWSSPAAIDGVVYVGSLNGDDNSDLYGYIYAVSADDGTERWRFLTDGPVLSSPAVVDSVVYVGSLDSNLYAMNAADGTERWRFTTGDYGIYPSPAIVNGVVYVGNGDILREGGTQLLAINADDGTLRWQFLTGGPVLSSPAVVDGVVYVGSDNGDNDDGLFGCIYAVSADDGTERWRFTAEQPFNSSPAVVGGVVYAGSIDNNLYAVNVADGTERWRFATDGGINSSPAVVDGVVYIGSQSGALYAIGARVPRLSVGGTARITEKTALRGGPAPTAVERAELQPDTVVTVTGESESSSDVIWWPVSVDETGDQGWVDGSKLEPLTSGQDPESTP